MKLLGSDILCTALLLFASAGTTSAAEPKKGGAAPAGAGAAPKAGLEFDASCNTKYGKMTAKEYINRSIKFMPELAKAGKGGLETFIQALEVQSQAPGAKKPTATPEDLKRIIATYRVLFGDLQPDDPAFQTDAKNHITKLKEAVSSLDRMANVKRPNLMIHCNDDWLDEKPKAPKVPKPTKPASKGHKYLYDTSMHVWEEIKGGKPCQGDKAAVTSTGKAAPGGKGQKKKESITFCKAYFDRQKQLETDGQAQLWDIPKNKLPAQFTTYKATGAKDETLPFHISAFGKKFGAKWFQEFMHTKLFNPGKDAFSDIALPNGEGGSSNKAFGFEGAVGLAKQNGGKNIAKSSRNIDNILYWSLAMYHDQYLWISGTPEDATALAAAPAEEAAPGADPAAAPAKVKRAGKSKKPKTEKKPDPPKTEKKPDPPKTDKPADPPKTDKPADPPKTSAAAPPKTSAAAPPPPPPTSQAAPPVTSKATPPVSSKTPPPQTSAPVSSQKSNSIHPSCSNTLCTRTSSMQSSSVSQQVPKETFEGDPINAGSMTGAEIAAIGATDIAAEVAAIGLWDQLFDETVPEETPTDELPTDELPTDGLPTDELPADGLPTDSTPTDGLPTDGLPTDSLPTDGLPTDSTPTDEVPTDGTPTDELPTDELPTDELPTGETPTDEVPTGETPTDTTPTDEVPTDEVPVDETPVDEIPIDETPVDETPADALPVDGTTPVDETPVDGTTPVDETPVDETPTDGLPTDEIPADELPADELPADELPVDETPVDELPTDETPVDELPVDETDPTLADETDPTLADETDPTTGLPSVNLPTPDFDTTDPTVTDPLDTLPTGTAPVEADPSASMGTGMPMPAGAANGTWVAPVLRSV